MTTPALRLATWSLHPIRLPYARSVRWEGSEESGALLLLLRLVGDGGAVGVAEVTVKPTWSGVSLRSVTAAIEDVLLPLLAGVDLADAAAVDTRLATVPENGLAKALVDNACWDLRAAAAGRPLWRLWDGRASVALSWAVTRQAPALMAAEAEGMVARFGFRTLKVKGGQGPSTDVEAVRAVRSAVGPDVALYVDANGAYRAEDAVGYVRALADEGALVVEDPYPLRPDAAFEAVQQAVPIPVLVDFGSASAADAALFLERGARALSLKPGRLGLGPCRAMAGQAVKGGCAVHVGLFGESALGSLAALQLAATLPEGGLPAEVTFFLMMDEQVTARPLEIVEGRVVLPEEAGSNSLIDWSRVERFAA